MSAITTINGLRELAAAAAIPFYGAALLNLAPQLLQILGAMLFIQFTGYATETLVKISSRKSIPRGKVTPLLYKAFGM